MSDRATVDQQEVVRFVAQILGQDVQAPGGIGGQCVDLINLWLLDVRRVPAVRANAVDWPHVKIAGYLWTPNTPTNIAPPGALVVWGPYGPLSIGANGHIALCLAGELLHLVTADQNWPDGAPVSLQLHSYAGVLGWHAPTI